MCDNFNCNIVITHYSNRPTIIIYILEGYQKYVHRLFSLQYIKDIMFRLFVT